MKKMFLSIATLLCAVCAIAQGSSSESASDVKTYYVYLSDGGIDAYDVADLDGGISTQDGKLVVSMKNDATFYYESHMYDSISTVAPSYPELTSFMFTNKGNHTLFKDAKVKTVSESMNLSLNAIGKWLAASFELSDNKAVAYVDTVFQKSGVTRQSFASPVTYTVTYPGYNKVGGIVKVKDELWGEVGGSTTEIPLTAAMLSTNKPSQNADEGLGNLLDNNASTIFHSTWGSANNETLNVKTYIDIDLPETAEKLKIYYKCRPQGGYNPLSLEIYGAGDDGEWVLVRTLTTADGMPTGGVSMEYTSPEITFDAKYSKVRILQASGEYSKNHMVLAEMRLYKVIPGEMQKISDEEYAVKRVPFGRDYTINVEWLTDKATSVPRIDIDIENGAEVVDKDTYLNAKFRITGYGVFDDFVESVEIKGRGNTTWGYPKKPYRLKFNSKVKPFGLTKGKSWVLLANYQFGSMLANAAAMKIGQLVGTEYPCHIVPVELYVNGTYRGSYMFTEKIGIAGNNVDIDDELGYLAELDTYYDEDYKFRSENYNLPVNVKDPDLSDYTEVEAAARLDLIREDIDKLDRALYYNAPIDDIIDVDVFARFMLANDLVLNQELGHPKSTYLFKEELENPESKIKFGPLWDFDWAFGYEQTRDYGVIDYMTSIFNSNMKNESGYRLFSDLMQNSEVRKHYYKVWKEFIENNSVEEFKDYMNSYYNYARSSFENNYSVWQDGLGYGTIKNNMNKWIANRAEYLYSSQQEYNLDEFNYPLACDVDKSNTLTVRDLAITTAYLKGNTHPAFTYSKADTNSDGFIFDSDVETIENAVSVAESLSPMQYYNTPMAQGYLGVNDFELAINEDCNMPVMLCDARCKALQMNITVPEGVTIASVAGGIAVTDHKVVMKQSDNGTYRVLVYSKGDELFNSEEVLLNLVLNASAVVAEPDRKVILSDILVVNDVTDEQRFDDVVASFAISTNINDVEAPTVSVAGGDGVITITSLAPQDINIYAVDGRLVRRLHVGEGSERVALPAGIYMVLGTKVTVK